MRSFSVLRALLARRGRLATVPAPPLAAQPLPLFVPSLHSLTKLLAFSTEQRTAEGLTSILLEELKHEREVYVKPEAVARGPPAPFTLRENAGDTMLTLSRAYGAETVNVDLHVNNQPSPSDEDEVEDAEEAQQLNTVVFNVHVTKGETSLVFECESDGQFVAINHLSYEPKAGIDSESTYTGPVFDELDEALQEELRSYLSERGISPELGEYLRHLVYDKEVREYQDWLQRVHDFVSKK